MKENRSDFKCNKISCKRRSERTQWKLVKPKTKTNRAITNWAGREEAREWDRERRKRSWSRREISQFPLCACQLQLESKHQNKNGTSRKIAKKYARERESVCVWQRQRQSVRTTTKLWRRKRERGGVEQCDKVATTATAANDIQSRFLDKNLIQTMGGYCGCGMSCVWRILRCETEPHTHTHTRQDVPHSRPGKRIKNVPGTRRKRNELIEVK